MTRFKELKRIQAAIDHKNRADLLWARGYCQMRLANIKTKARRTIWPETLKRVEALLREIDDGLSKPL